MMLAFVLNILIQQNQLFTLQRVIKANLEPKRDHDVQGE